MKLTYTLGPEIVHLLTEIAEKKGEVKAYFLNRLEPRSREANKQDSVFATLHLQDHQLTREQTKEILQFQSVRAPRSRIMEVKNTMRVYENLVAYQPFSQVSFKSAYQELQEEPGTPAAYRKDCTFYYYFRGDFVQSVPVREMKTGIKEMFHYLRYGKDPLLVKSCLCHYAIQFYQPFDADNEKMSRLWQTLLLMKEHPSFEFLPWEMEVLKQEKEYFTRLPGPVRKLDATEFVIYLLEIINLALTAMLESCRRSVRPIDRIQYFYTLHQHSFTRKEYMLVHKNISATTASRDLDLGVEIGFFEKRGNNNQTSYRCRRLLE
jgi:Fic family protein